MDQVSTKKMTPGDDMHLTLLMAPHNLNLVTGQDRQHLLAFGRAAFEAGQKCQGCSVPPNGLHQIAEASHSMSQYASKDDMLKAVMAENEQLRAQLAAAQQGVQAQDVELRIGELLALARRMVRTALDADNTTEMQEIKAAIDSEVEFERALRNTLAATHPTPQGLEQSVQKVVQEWQRQKNLFPQLHKDGWMDLALSELAAQAKQAGV